MSSFSIFSQLALQQPRKSWPCFAICQVSACEPRLCSYFSSNQCGGVSRSGRKYTDGIFLSECRRSWVCRCSLPIYGLDWAFSRQDLRDHNIQWTKRADLRYLLPTMRTRNTFGRSETKGDLDCRSVPGPTKRLYPLVAGANNIRRPSPWYPPSRRCSFPRSTRLVCVLPQGFILQMPRIETNHEAVWRPFRQTAARAWGKLSIWEKNWRRNSFRQGIWDWGCVSPWVHSTFHAGRITWIAVINGLRLTFCERKYQ